MQPFVLYRKFEGSNLAFRYSVSLFFFLTISILAYLRQFCHLNANELVVLQPVNSCCHRYFDTIDFRSKSWL